MAQEEQFVAFVDLLGFAETVRTASVATQESILHVLTELAKSRSNFSISRYAGESESDFSFSMAPAVSAFSDHVVISYPIGQISGSETHEALVSFAVLSQAAMFLTSFASGALERGFLLRGGATIGLLHHSDGVVFGPALIEAFNIESRMSIYPRVLLSKAITGRWDVAQEGYVSQDFDGLLHLDITAMMARGLQFNQPSYRTDYRRWFLKVAEIVRSNLTDLDENGRLAELAKWRWLARRFREEYEALPPDWVKERQLDGYKLPWL